MHFPRRIWTTGCKHVHGANLGAVVLATIAVAAAPASNAGAEPPPALLSPAAIEVAPPAAASPVPVPARHAITEPYSLPAAGEVVPLDRIHAICSFYGLEDLWQKIERDPPARPFVSDGVTGWFDDWHGVSLYPAGFLHDLKYWAGYPHEDVARLVADAELMIDVAHLLNSTEMAETMFHGVRVGGTAKFKTPFRWGFGRP